MYIFVQRLEELFLSYWTIIFYAPTEVVHQLKTGGDLRSTELLLTFLSGPNFKVDLRPRQNMTLIEFDRGGGRNAITLIFRGKHVGYQ